MENRIRSLLNRRWSKGGLTERTRGIDKIAWSELGRPHARLGNPNTGVPEVLVQDVYDIYFIRVP